jgi:hypothetical protein
MHDEAEISASIALAVRSRGRGRLAKARRPGERKNVKIEISGRARGAAQSLDPLRQEKRLADAAIPPAKSERRRGRRGADPRERDKGNKGRQKTRQIA